MLQKLAEKMTLRVSMSNHTLIRLLLVALVFILGLQFLYATRSALTLVVVAFFLALALNPPVSWLSRRLPGNSRGLATAVAYLAVLLFLGLIIYATVPPLVSQTRDFIDKLPDYAEELKDGDSFAARQVERFQLADEIDEFESWATSNLSDVAGPIFSLLQRIGANLISVITVLVLTFFMLVEGPQWMRRFLALQPKSKRAHRQALAERMYRVVTGYVNGQLIVAFIAATSALTIMSVLKVFNIDIPFIIPLSAIVLITGLIPLIGNTLGAVIVVAVSLFESIPAAIIMAVFFLIYQQIENNAIQPVIQARSVEMTPLMILIAAIFGVTVAGLLGALLAIPVAGCLRILFNDYVDRHKLRSADQSEVGAV